MEQKLHRAQIRENRSGWPADRRDRVELSNRHRFPSATALVQVLNTIVFTHRVRAPSNDIQHRGDSHQRVQQSLYVLHRHRTCSGGGGCRCGESERWRSASVRVIMQDLPPIWPGTRHHKTHSHQRNIRPARKEHDNDIETLAGIPRSQGTVASMERHPFQWESSVGSGLAFLTDAIALPCHVTWGIGGAGFSCW